MFFPLPQILKFHTSLVSLHSFEFPSTEFRVSRAHVMSLMVTASDLFKHLTCSHQPLLLDRCYLRKRPQNHRVDVQFYEKHLI